MQTNNLENNKYKQQKYRDALLSDIFFLLTAG